MQRLIRPPYYVEGRSNTSGYTKAIAGIAEIFGWNIIFASAYVMYGAFVSTLEPVSALAWMSAFAAATALAVSRRTPGDLAKLRRANPILLAVQAASSAISFVILFALLSREHAVSVLALILIIPVMNVIVAAIAFDDGASWAWWATGFLLCLSGTASFRFSGTPTGPGTSAAVALAIAYVCFSVTSSIVKSALTRNGAGAAGVALVGYAATSLTAFAVASAAGLLTVPTYSQIACLFYLGVIPTAAGAIGFQRVLDRVGYPTAEAVGMTKPFLGYLIALGLALAGMAEPPQTLNVVQLGGLCAAVVGSTVCVILGRPPATSGTHRITTARRSRIK